jgi:hypothetical protein
VEGDRLQRENDARVQPWANECLQGIRIDETFDLARIDSFVPSDIPQVVSHPRAEIVDLTGFESGLCVHGI